DSPGLYGRERHGRRDQSQRHPRPEALGSPRGYVVPSGCRLLWPHPNLSRPPVDLWIRRQVLATAGRERVPNLLCVSVPSCRPLDPDGPSGRTRLSLHRPQWPSPSSQRLGIRIPARTCTRAACHEANGFAFAAARWIAGPAPARTFTFELSPPELPQQDVEYDYAGRQPVPAAGLPPAGHAALWAANETHEVQEKQEKEFRVFVSFVSFVA